MKTHLAIFLLGGAFFQLVRMIYLILKTDMVIVARGTIYDDPSYLLYHQECGGDVVLKHKINSEGHMCCKKCGRSVSLFFEGSKFVEAILRTIKDNKKRRVVQHWKSHSIITGEPYHCFTNIVFKHG